jgi:hypothetical protein
VTGVRGVGVVDWTAPGAAIGGWFEANITGNASSSANSAYGVYIPSAGTKDAAAPVLTDSYGIYLLYQNAVTTGALRDYAMYIAGNFDDGNQSIFEGHVGIGQIFTLGAFKDLFVSDWESAQLVVGGRGDDITPYPGSIIIADGDSSIIANQVVGEIKFFTDDVSQSSAQYYAKIDVISEQTISSNIAPGSLRLFTTSTSAGASPTERMRITSAGDVGIGVTPTLGMLHLDRGTGVGQATLDGSTGGCLMLRDTDDAGWTECDALDGVLSCSIDADGLCD